MQKSKKKKKKKKSKKPPKMNQNKIKSKQNVYAPSWRDLVGNSAESFEAQKREVEIYQGKHFPSCSVGIKVLGHTLYNFHIALIPLGKV